MEFTDQLDRSVVTIVSSAKDNEDLRYMNMSQEDEILEESEEERVTELDTSNTTRNSNITTTSTPVKRQKRNTSKPVRIYSCKTCTYKTKFPSNFKRHEGKYAHRRYECTHCSVTYAAKYDPRRGGGLFHYCG